MPDAPDRDAAALPAELRERYEFVRDLGAGGMGEVVLARDRELGREVAIKRLRKPGDPALLERFRREARALARLEHPHVLRVFGFGELREGGAYLLTEYISGASLEDEPAPPDRDERLFEVAEALEFLHAEGLVHRDVKPANILVAGGGRAVLIDLGLVADIEATRLTATGQMVGTPAYLAPEVLAGEEPRAPADWYAWGATWYVLAEGGPPFEMSDLVAATGGDPLPPPVFRRLPPAGAVAGLLRRCLDPDPTRRPSGVAEIREALAEVPARSHGGPEPPPAQAPARGQRVRRAGLLAAGLVAGAGLLLPMPDGAAPPAEVARSPAPSEGRPGAGLATGIAALTRELGAIDEIDPDPRSWPAVATRLPALRELERRALAEDLADLGHPDRAALLELGARFRSLGLPAPLARMLGPMPDRPVELRALPTYLDRESPRLPARADAGSRLGAMELEARVMAEAFARLREILRDDRALAEFSGIPVRDVAAWQLTGGMDQPDDLVEMMARIPSRRRRLMRELAGPLAAMERLLFHAAVAGAEPGAAGEIAAFAGGRVLDESRLFLCSPRLLEPALPVEFEEPATPALWLLRYELLRQTRKVARSFDLEGGSGLERALRAAQAPGEALEPGSLAAEVVRYRRSRALGEELEAALRDAGPGDLETLAPGVRAALPALRPGDRDGVVRTLVESVLATGRARDLPPGMGEELVAALRHAMKTRPPERAKDRRRWAERIEALAAALRR